MRNKLTTLAATAVLSLCLSTSLLAGSVTQPGETVGLAAGAPLPPGFYFVNTADWGCRDTAPEQTCVGVTIPVGAWSTPWTFLGARVHFLVATPAVEVGIHNTTHLSGMYNPLVAGQLAWQLGNTGWNFSYLLGAYFDVHSEVAWSSTSINQRFALSYTKDNWNLTANLIWGIQLDQVTDRPQLSGCPAPFALNGCNPDFINLDLTAAKKFGNWQIGAVGFGSWDVSTPVAGYAKQSQFALGGLLGYDFGKVIVQGYATTDVTETNYGGRDTRGWMRFIFVLGDPFAQPAAAAPVVRKY